MIDRLKLNQRYENIYRHMTDWSLARHPYWLRLKSGFQVGIDSLVTLSLFDEIFASEIYSPAFDLLDRIDFVVDLGANRGLFMVYVYHKLNALQTGNFPRMVCVEPVNDNIRRLVDHAAKNHLSDYVTPVAGVVTGQRSGQNDFSYYSRHHVTGKVGSEGVGKIIRVNNIDLAKYVKNRSIDILKVDIEGSEQEFLGAYEDLLAVTKVLMVEFHINMIDHPACQSSIQNSGLRLFCRNGCDGETTIIETYTRQ